MSGELNRQFKEGLPRRRRPCVECPWRRDVAAGKFGRDRFDALAGTAGGPGCEAGVGAPMFVCHKSREGSDKACAGWLATVGADHLGVRIAVVRGDLDPAALQPGEGWPLLFDSFEEMAAVQAAADGAFCETGTGSGTPMIEAREG
ncbi:DUF6283 family protein [Rhodococcus sp. D-6]|uniref:DUF6283 family protein n=1 Tax=Rhodococcus sp. D-6 TaxID=1387842 RepID=A0AAU7UU35_9NOCA